MTLRYSLIPGMMLSLTASMLSCSDDTPVTDNTTEPPLPPKYEVEIKPKGIWIDTEANFVKFARKDAIDAELAKIKKYGLNMVYIDAKSSNGYANYKSDILPYCTQFATLGRECDYDDYTGYMVERCSELGIDVVASLNCMCWGWHRGDRTQGYIYDDFDKWKDKVQVRSDELNPDITVPITEDPRQEFIHLDPIYPEVQQLLIDVCCEIVRKYPGLKGLGLDYLRYCNNDGGWFGLGDDNLKAYAEYWGEAVPGRHEILTPTGGPGPKFAKWIEFRSAVVSRLIARVREAVKAINPDIEIHLWAAADWGSRYSVGQNFASQKFHPTGGQYTDTYNRTGFAEYLDVFVTGAYCKGVWKSEMSSPNDWNVENFVTTWQDYIMDACKCYGSIAAYELDAARHSDATYLCLKHCDGFSTFELSHVNNRDLWVSLAQGISRYERNK